MLSLSTATDLANLGKPESEHQEASADIDQITRRVNMARVRREEALATQEDVLGILQLLEQQDVVVMSDTRTGHFVFDQAVQHFLVRLVGGRES
jgi:hypothetical protein